MTSLGSPRDIGHRDIGQNADGSSTAGLFATGSTAPDVGRSSRPSPFSADETQHDEVLPGGVGPDESVVDLRNGLWVERSAPADSWGLGGGTVLGAAGSSGRSRFGQTSPAIIVVGVIVLAVVLTVAGLMLSVWLGPLATDFYSG